MSMDLAHVPTFLKDAAGALHRYVNSGEALAKSELHRLMAELHKLIEHVPDEAKVEAPAPAAVEVAPVVVPVAPVEPLSPLAAAPAAPEPGGSTQAQEPVAAPEAAPAVQDPVTHQAPAEPAPTPAAPPDAAPVTTQTTNPPTPA